MTAAALGAQLGNPRESARAVGEDELGRAWCVLPSRQEYPLFGGSAASWFERGVTRAQGVHEKGSDWPGYRLAVSPIRMCCR